MPVSVRYRGTERSPLLLIITKHMPLQYEDVAKGSVNRINPSKI